MENQGPTTGLTPHLAIPDKRGAEAIDFYGKAFGATEQARVLADDGVRLMHAHLTVNGASLMMHDDFPEYTGGAMAPPSGVTLHLQVDDTDAWYDRAIAAGFAFKGDRPGYLGDYGSPLRDGALMIALTHERGFAKPAYDARAIEIGRDLHARRRMPWFWLSTQEQVAIARMGKALLANPANKVSGTLSADGGTESITEAKAFGRGFDFAALAGGVRFSPQGKPLTQAGLRTIFRHHRIKAGVPAGHPHALRHSFGTALAEAAVDLAVLQALMGHDHVDSSAAYIHLSPAHVRAAYDAARDRQRAHRGGCCQAAGAAPRYVEVGVA